MHPLSLKAFTGIQDMLREDEGTTENRCTGRDDALTKLGKVGRDYRKKEVEGYHTRHEALLNE